MQNDQLSNLLKATAISLVICAIAFAIVVFYTQQTFDGLGRMVLCGADKSIIEFNDLIERLKKLDKPSYLQILSAVWPALIALLVAEVTVINLKIKKSATNQQKTALKEMGYITLIALIALLAIALAGWLEYCHLCQATR